MSNDIRFEVEFFFFLAGEGVTGGGGWCSCFCGEDLVASRTGALALSCLGGFSVLDLAPGFTIVFRIMGFGGYEIVCYFCESMNVGTR